MTALAATLPAVLFAAISGSACAHGLSADLGGFQAGMLHPVAVPAHLLALFALALLYAQQGRGGPAMALPRIAAGCVAGFALARPDAGIAVQLLLLGAAAAAGMLVAAALEPTRAVAAALTAALTAAIAFAIVLDSAPDVPNTRDRLAALAGTGVAISAGFVWTCAWLASLRRPWQRIGIRIVGSWTSACAFLVLALAASGRLTAGGVA